MSSALLLSRYKAIDSRAGSENCFAAGFLIRKLLPIKLCVNWAGPPFWLNLTFYFEISKFFFFGAIFWKKGRLGSAVEIHTDKTPGSWILLFVCMCGTRPNKWALAKRIQLVFLSRRGTRLFSSGFPLAVLLLHNAHHFLGDPKINISQGRVKMRGPGDRYIKPAAANNPSIRQVYFLVIATKIKIKLERERN